MTEEPKSQEFLALRAEKIHRRSIAIVLTPGFLVLAFCIATELRSLAKFARLGGNAVNDIGRQNYARGEQRKIARRDRHSKRCSPVSALGCVMAFPDPSTDVLRGDIKRGGTMRRVHANNE